MSNSEKIFSILGLWVAFCLVLAAYYKLGLVDLLDIVLIHANYVSVEAFLYFLGGIYLSYETWRIWTNSHPACKTDT